MIKLLTTIGIIISLILSVLALFEAIIKVEKLIFKVAEWVKKQEEMTIELASIKQEQQIIMVGNLTCLKAQLGIIDEKEIKEIVKMTEDHINKKAHE